MANTNFKIFAEASTDLQTDAEYSTDSQRINGVSPGLALPAMHNKLYRQATIMAAALAQVLVERGHDAMDNDYEGLVAGIRQAFARSINGIEAGENGDIDYTLLGFNDIYPVGSIFMNADGKNPSTLFGGTWVQISGGRCLIGANDEYKAGSTGGEATHVLTADEMPEHKHSVSVTKAGMHKHNRGTMEITGAVKLWKYYAADGAFYINGSWGYSETKNGGGDPTARAEFKASRTWTGETNAAGEHDHPVTIGNTGGGAAHNNMQPYLVVYIWQRTA